MPRLKSAGVVIARIIQSACEATVICARSRVVVSYRFPIPGIRLTASSATTLTIAIPDR